MEIANCMFYIFFPAFVVIPSVGRPDLSANSFPRVLMQYNFICVLMKSIFLCINMVRVNIPLTPVPLCNLGGMTTKHQGRILQANCASVQPMPELQGCGQLSIIHKFSFDGLLECLHAKMLSINYSAEQLNVKPIIYINLVAYIIDLLNLLSLQTFVWNLQ